MFFRGSRYEGVAESDLVTSSGRVVRYKRIRFIAEIAGTMPYLVVEGDRPDLIAYKAFNNSELFWRICDANGVMGPDELVARPGRRLMIPVHGP